MNIFEVSILGINAIGIGYLIILQRKIISGYESVFKSTDIKRLVEYYEKIDELTKKHAIKIAQESLNATLADFESKIGAQYDEMATFIDGIYLTLKAKDEDEAKTFIAEHFPHSQELFPYKSNPRDVIARNVYGK
jgi:3-methyladenine DNA glycosylase Tag